MADLCSYSSYVRDTRDEAVSRRALTSFASMTRHRVINDGGMLYQFQGDSVIGLFGVPEEPPGYLERRSTAPRAHRHRRLGRDRVAAPDRPGPAGGRRARLDGARRPPGALAPPAEPHPHGRRRRLHQPRGAPQQRRGMRRDRGEQHALSAPARGRSARSSRNCRRSRSKNIGRIRAWKLGPAQGKTQGLLPSRRAHRSQPPGKIVRAHVSCAAGAARSPDHGSGGYPGRPTGITRAPSRLRS